MISATSKTFDAIVSESPEVLIDFHAPWCGPCKAMEPVLTALDGAPLPIVKVDIDAETDLAVRFGIQGVPTFVVLRKGDVVAQKVGAMSGGNMKKWISDARAA
jgi:thioredoxin 1